MRLLFFTTLCLIIFWACQQNQGPANEPNKDQVFFSINDPGRWEGMQTEHNPIIKTQKLSGQVKVRVEVPLTVSQGHYIEVILLADKSNKELFSKTFSRGKLPEATFDVPAGKAMNLIAIIKCNLHNMWVREIDFADQSP